MRPVLKPKKKKLRNGPIIEVDPQILRWRLKRRKLQIRQEVMQATRDLYMDLLNTSYNAPESPINASESMTGTLPTWDMFKPE